MAELLPLFPLDVVLFPGQVLPLHIFEERYRDLVRDLLSRAEPRRFGVIRVRDTFGLGDQNHRLLHDIGCIAELREAEPYEDGRFDIVTVGVQRFRVGRLDDSRSYLCGEFEGLADEPASDELVPSVQAGFRAYLDALVQHGGATVRVADLPDEPVLLSYVVAAALIIGLPERQDLLSAADAAQRLGMERDLLARETSILRATASRSAPDLQRTPFSPN